jgi:hypothetical protein
MLGTVLSKTAVVVESGTPGGLQLPDTFREFALEEVLSQSLVLALIERTIRKHPRRRFKKNLQYLCAS